MNAKYATTRACKSPHRGGTNVLILKKLALYSAARQYPTMVAPMKADSSPTATNMASPIRVIRKCRLAKERRIKIDAGKYNAP